MFKPGDHVQWQGPRFVASCGYQAEVSLALWTIQKCDCLECRTGKSVAVDEWITAEYRMHLSPNDLVKVSLH